MGLRSISVSFRNDDQQAVAAAHQMCFPGQRAVISPPADGWTTLYDERLDSFQEADVTAIASSICCRLACPALGLSVLHSDYFDVWAFDIDGQLAIRFSDVVSGAVDTADATSLAGIGEQVANLFQLQGLAPSLQSVIESRCVILMDEKVQSLCELLGIRFFGWSYFVAVAELDEDDDFELEGKEFLHVP